MRQPAFARALRRAPASVEPIGRRDGEQADIAAVLGDQANGFDGFRAMAPV